MKKLKLLAITLVTLCLGGVALGDETAVNSYRVNDHVYNVNKSGDFGLGLMLGSTSGVTGKYWTSEQTALDMGVSFINSNTALMADYLWHWRDAFVSTGGNNGVAQSFVPYLGLGLIAGFGPNNSFFSQSNQSFEMGIRVPLGLEFMPRSIPLGFFAQIEPGIGFVPNGFTFIGGNLGGRYYF